VAELVKLPSTTWDRRRENEKKTGLNWPPRRNPSKKERARGIFSAEQPLGPSGSWSLAAVCDRWRLVFLPWHYYSVS